MDLTNLPMVPEVVIERMGTAHPCTLAPSTAPFTAGGQPHDPFAAPARAFTERQAAGYCRAQVAKLESATQGINHHLFETAVLVGHFVPQFLSAQAATEWLKEAQRTAWLARGGADDGDYTAALRTISGGLARGMAEPYVRRDEPDPLAAPADDEPAGAGPDADLAFEVARQRRQRDARALLDAEEAARQADDAAVAALVDQLLTSAALDDIPDLEPLIDGWLFKDSMARLIGKSGTYKSFVALDMACHVAAGKAWFGHECATGAVVYVVAEGARGVRRRVRAWESKHMLPLGDKLLILPRPVQMVGPEWLAFVGACKAVGAAMVVLDTQARVTVGVEENSAREMGQVVAMGERLRVDTGACILLVHHTGHAGEHGRGSTSVYGALQTELALERVANQRVSLKATKQKDHDELGPVNLKLEPCCESLVLANLNGMDDVSAPAIEDSMRTLTMASGTHAERVAIVLHGVWRGGHGATRAELLAAVREEYAKAGLAEIGKSAFHRAMTSIQANGWTREGRTAARMILSSAGCVHLGVDYEGPFDLDETGD